MPRNADPYHFSPELTRISSAPNMSDPVLDTEDVVGTIFALRELTALIGKRNTLEIAGERGSVYCGSEPRAVLTF